MVESTEATDARDPGLLSPGLSLRCYASRLAPFLAFLGDAWGPPSLLAPWVAVIMDFYLRCRSCLGAGLCFCMPSGGGIMCAPMSTTMSWSSP